jgi:hypothetical protein
MESNREYWRSISEYPNYEISSVGRVRNAISGKILKQQIESNGYHRICLYKDGTRKLFYIHRLVCQEFINNPDNKPSVDHIDGVKTNNCISNLRWATHHDNQGNRKKTQNTSSIYKGVCFHKQHQKWSSRFMIDGKYKHLGYFDTEIDAALTYNEAAIIHFGDFAKLNHIDILNID